MAVARLGFAVPPQRAQRVAEVGMAAGIVRLDFDGALVAGDGGMKGAFGAERHAHIVERLRGFGINLQRLHISRDRLIEAALVVGARGLFEYFP
ncbi:MAG: hypothetical protein VCD31_18765 [Alphaproteobacteria bacterium]